MFKYILKRLILSAFILIIVMFLIYALMYSLPQGYVETRALELANKPGNLKPYSELLTELQARYGLDQGMVAGFFTYLGNFFTGNFGDSWYYTIPVTSVFHNTIWNSFILGVVSFIAEILIAIPLGVLAARKQYSKTDYAVTVVSLIGISLPTFFTAALLKLIFSLKLGWFEVSGMHNANLTPGVTDSFTYFLDGVAHFVLPALTIIIVSIGGLMRYTRTNMLEVLNADYIRTARAKGVSERKVVYKHAFRNTLIPLVTLLGGSLPGLFAGALITETLFSINGIGYASYNAMVGGDIPFTMFYLTFMAILTLLGNLASDICYALVDPRVRFD
ncbi:MAG: ABC transporter permease [Clostridia bacterium]|nr:ABC transporter permease [Clostridia bacterium]